MTSILFTSWTLLSVFLTVNVFFPFAKRSKSSLHAILFSFIFSWIIGDLLPQWIILNVGIILIFAFSDIFNQPLGWAGLVVHLISWFILILRLWVIVNMPERIELKMVEILGIKWQKICPRVYPPRNIFEVDWKCWLNPNKILEDPHIEIERDKVFYNEGGVDLKLDIYRPINRRNKHPGILQIHGGGWIIGSKKQASVIMTRMARRGWICFSISYRLSPDVIFPEHLIDIKRALKWIRNNATEYGLDPDFIVATGGSAGGHLATMTALTQNLDDFQPDFEKADTSIQGCVSIYGIYNFLKPFNENTPFPAKAQILEILCGGTPETKPDLFKQITPSNWLSKNCPPFLLIQGENDTLISITDMERFWEELQSQKIPDSAILTLPMVEHAFDIFPTLTAQCIVPTIERYLIMLHENYLYSLGDK